MSTPPLPKGLRDSRVNRVANQLHSAAIHLLRDARLADRETGLSPERLSLLSVVVFAGPLSLSRLAEAEQVSRPAISRTIKALVEAGLVETRRNPEDRRSVTVRATARGRRLLEAGRRRRVERIASRLAHLSDAELDRLGSGTELLEQSTSSSA